MVIKLHRNYFNSSADVSTEEIIKYGTLAVLISERVTRIPLAEVLVRYI